jgi:hypothetical protein
VKWPLRADSHIPCRSHAVPKPFPCRSHAVPLSRSCHSPMLIRTHTMPFPCRSSATTLPRPCRGLERSLSERHIRGMAWERMARVNQTRSHCVNQMGKTQSKRLAERHGRETAWERYGMCESAFNITNSSAT